MRLYPNNKMKHSQERYKISEYNTNGKALNSKKCAVSNTFVCYSFREKSTPQD